MTGRVELHGATDQYFCFGLADSESGRRRDRTRVGDKPGARRSAREVNITFAFGRYRK